MSMPHASALFSPAALFRWTALALLGVITYFARADHETLGVIERLVIRHDVRLDAAENNIVNLRQDVRDLQRRGKILFEGK